MDLFGKKKRVREELAERIRTSDEARREAFKPAKEYFERWFTLVNAAENKFVPQFPSALKGEETRKMQELVREFNERYDDFNSLIESVKDQLPGFDKGDPNIVFNLVNQVLQKRRWIVGTDGMKSRLSHLRKEARKLRKEHREVWTEHRHELFRAYKTARRLVEALENLVNLLEKKTEPYFGAIEFDKRNHARL